LFEINGPSKIFELRNILVFGYFTMSLDEQAAINVTTTRIYFSLAILTFVIARQNELMRFKPFALAISPAELDGASTIETHCEFNFCDIFLNCGCAGG